jgi:hypothetical protein
VKNYNRLVIELLFCTSLIIPYEGISRHEAKKLACSVVQAVYSAFKAQIFLSHAFRENKGQLSQNQVLSQFEAQSQKLEDNENIVQSQVQFLRLAAAAVLVF